MKDPVHHPDTLIAEYAAGSTSEALSLVAACHLTLCASCRHRVGELEMVGGAVLDASPGLPVSEAAVDHLLARLDENGALEPTPPARALPRDGQLPRPLLRYLNGAPWRRLVPGVQHILLPISSANVRLVRLKPGLPIPLHDHGGPEYALVFAGGLIEQTATYHRGDVSVRQSRECHRQWVEKGEPCIALLVTHGPLIPLTWSGRLLGWMAAGK